MYPRTLYREHGQRLIVHTDDELARALLAFWSLQPVEPEPEPEPEPVPVVTRRRGRKG